MLIKNTNPNELLAEFERDKNFCPYNEEEIERLKKEGERLYNDISSSIYIFHNGVNFKYRLSSIFDKNVSYEYEEYGSICKISSAYSPEQTEYVRFEDFGKIVFFYKSTNSDKTVWHVEVHRTGDRNQEVWLWFGEEVKFKKVGY
jgi:hypothetical protein